MINERKKEIFLIPHTHWDRGWYLPYEKYRAGLIEVFNRLFHFYENGSSLPPFFLDGQSILLEDYLELMPEKREIISTMVRGGKLHIGPLYIQPDEFLSHPEALIRNFNYGIRLAREFGKSLNICYLPDTWGHVSQLPQICSGFNLEAMIFGRGYGEDLDKRGIEFLWEGKDKTRILSVFMLFGYINGINLGYPGKWGDTASQYFDLDKAAEDIKKAADDLADYTRSGCLLLMNGGDHVLISPELDNIINHARNKFNLPINTDGVESMIHQIKRKQNNLEVYKGELRSGRYSFIVSGTLTSRIYLKQLNNKLSRLLIKNLEPILSFSLIAGGTYDQCLLDRCWKLLLQNLSHDEIGGCGIDDVHIEMLLRYKKIEQLIQILEIRGKRKIVFCIELDEDMGEPYLLFNPSNDSVNGYHKAVFSIDNKNKKIDPACFSILDSKGQVLDHQLLTTRQTFSMEINKGGSRTEQELVFKYPDLPACGINYVYLTPNKGCSVPESGNNALILENKYFCLDLTKPDKVISITDKINSLKYDNFISFLEEADAGDEYNFSPLTGATVIDSSGIESEDCWIHKGPFYYSISRRFTLRVPESINSTWDDRAQKFVGMPISLIFGMYIDSSVLHMDIKVDNQAKNHRLRLNLSLENINCYDHVRGEHYCQGSISPEDFQPDYSNWKEPLNPARHFLNYNCFNAGEYSALVMSEDVSEYEVIGNNNVAYTLFRGVGDLSLDNLTTRKGGAGFIFKTPDAQCKGSHEFLFGFSFFKGETEPSTLFKTAERFLNPAIVFSGTDYPGVLPNEIDHPDMPRRFDIKNIERKQRIPEKGYLVKISDPQVLILALKPVSATGSYLLRVINYSETPVHTSISFMHPVKRIQSVNLNDESLGDIIPDDFLTIPSRMASWEIRSFMITPE